MATPVLESSFTTGEVAPALFGNVQLARMHAAASTMRNFFVGYQGGAYSRAGTAFVGFSKQTGRDYPPRMVTFQFNIDQGLALEFGNFYMRVISDGGYVTESPAVITNISQANPGVLTFGTEYAVSATPINTAVSSSYAPGDTVTLAGGTFSTPAVLLLETTALLSIVVHNPGSNAGGYAPNQTINLSGGTFSVAPVLRVVTTKVVYAQVGDHGFGGSTGPAVVTGTTGTGTKFQLNVTLGLNDGVIGILTVDSIAVAGSYSVNPNNGVSLEPVTGGGLTGATVHVYMGVETVVVLQGGAFTANAPGGNMAQLYSSGSGTGATFQTALFGPNTLSVQTQGVYTVFPTNPVAQGGTSGGGVGAEFTVVSATPTFNDGDWLFIQNVSGMTQINGTTVVVQPLSPTTYAMFDVYGDPINTTILSAYTSGGTASRIYTLQTPYSEVDLKYLKFTQSADVMSLCLVNQKTFVEYEQQDLARLAADSWALTPAVPLTTAVAPTNAAGTASSSGSSNYEYVITSVTEDGTESVRSNIAKINSAVSINSTAGTITMTWSAALGATKYNVYKATPQITAAVPDGVLFGYVGSAYGLSFIDDNIVPDFTQVPPQHRNPFARGRIISARPTTGGAAYTTVTITVNSATGTGAVLTGVLTGGALSAIIVENEGENYSDGDTITVGGTGGSGATAVLTVGPQSGTYPAVPAYFQQRRVYAYTLNQPDTYFMSQPGAYLNFDRRIPTIDSDSITGTPWSVEVNGIQFMIPVAGGLVVLTGLEAYFVNGAGGSAFSPQPITPSSQSAQPQGFNGCSATVPPVRIYQDVLYVQAKGSTYRDFAFSISLNTYTGEDITQNSTHLFNGYQIVDHAWCEEPSRVLWAVRDDGVLLSLTYVKPEKVQGWARHDTNGRFASVCSVTEPPVDALYAAVERQIGSQTAYVIERMNNRLWKTVEDAWCVDCGFSLPMDTPNAILASSSATGLGACTGVTGLVGGTGYSAAATATVVDDNGRGPGTGATPVLTIVGGVITAVAFPNQGTGYVRPKLVITDPAGSAGGSGASAIVTLSNAATFTADSPVFSGGDVGRVIRMGGGVATVTAFIDTRNVAVNITSPIAAVQPNTTRVQNQPAGSWTISTPITTVQGLGPLAGATVTGLADGVKIPPMVVSDTGEIVLDRPASQITIGLGFQAQLQSVYLDAGEPTVQGQRKVIAEGTARIQASGPFLMGSNQVDGSTQSPILVAPQWSMVDAPISTQAPYNSVTVPLCTDDIRIPINTGYAKHGQVCVQQDDPYPLNVLAFVPSVLTGDTSSQAWPKKEGKRG